MSNKGRKSIGDGKACHKMDRNVARSLSQKEKIANMIVPANDNMKKKRENYKKTLQAPQKYENYLPEKS